MEGEREKVFVYNQEGWGMCLYQRYKDMNVYVREWKLKEEFIACSIKIILLCSV